MIRRMGTLKFLIIFLIINEYSSATQHFRVVAEEIPEEGNSMVIPLDADFGSDKNSSDNSSIDFIEEDQEVTPTTTENDSSAVENAITEAPEIKSQPIMKKHNSPFKFRSHQDNSEETQAPLMAAVSKHSFFKSGTPMNVKLKRPKPAKRRRPIDHSQLTTAGNTTQKKLKRNRQRKQFKKQKMGENEKDLPSKPAKKRRPQKKRPKVQPTKESIKVHQPTLKPDDGDQVPGCSIEGRWYNRWGTEILFQLGPTIGNMQDVEGMYLGEIPLKTSAPLRGIKTLLKNRASFGFITALRGPVMGFVGQCYIINNTDILEGMWLHKKPSTLQEDWDSIRVGFDIFKRIPREKDNTTSMVKKIV